MDCPRRLYLYYLSNQFSLKNQLNNYRILPLLNDCPICDLVYVLHLSINDARLSVSMLDEPFVTFMVTPKFRGIAKGT